MAYKVFSNGNTLNASELNTYLMNQSVMVFATSTARDSALPLPLEGMLTWIEDLNRFTYYDGSAWVSLGANGGFLDKSSNYAITSTDVGKTIRSTGSAITITINNVMELPGERIDFIQAGTGQITFAAGSGVTLLSVDTKLKTTQQYAGASVVFGGSGTYYLIGNLA